MPREVKDIKQFLEIARRKDATCELCTDLPICTVNQTLQIDHAFPSYTGRIPQIPEIEKRTRMLTKYVYSRQNQEILQTRPEPD